MIMSYHEESKAGAEGDEVAELLSRPVEATGAFSRTAHREPTLRLFASQGGR
jgi:hypothetical protein